MPVVEWYGGGQRDPRWGRHLVDIQTVVLLAVLISVLGSYWKLHSEILAVQDRVASLQERMAHLEGLFEGFTGPTK